MTWSAWTANVRARIGRVMVEIPSTTIKASSAALLSDIHLAQRHGTSCLISLQTKLGILVLTKLKPGIKLDAGHHLSISYSMPSFRPRKVPWTAATDHSTPQSGWSGPCILPYSGNIGNPVLDCHNQTYNSLAGLIAACRASTIFKTWLSKTGKYTVFYHRASRKF
jgi:hypothetical protein